MKKKQARSILMKTFYVAQHILNIFLKCNEHKYVNKIFYFPFFIVNFQNPVYMLDLQYNLNQMSHISSKNWLLYWSVQL